MARAEGIPAANILIDDDVAVNESIYSHGRRGTGTAVPELYVAYRKLVEVCQKKGLTVVRNLIGTYIAAIEMQGVSSPCSG